MIRLPREVWLLASAQVLWGVGYGLLAPVWPLFLRELGAGAQDIGLVFGLGNIFAALSFIPAGYLADRIGRKPILVVSWAASTAGAAAFLPLQDWHGAFVGSMLYWSGAAAVPVMTAQLAATTERRSLGRALGIVFGAYFFGNILSAPFAGFIAAGIGLRATIGLAVLAFMISTTLIFGVRSMPPATERERLRFPRPFWTLLAITPFASLISIVSLTLLPVYLRDIAAVPLERVGLYVALVAVGAAVLVPLAGRLADEFGAVPALLGAATVLTVGTGLIALSGRSEPLIALSALLLGATQAANPVLAAAVERILPPTRVALGYATYQLAFAIGFGSGGTVAGFLYEADPLLPFLVTVALALPVAATVAVVVARIAPRVRVASPA
ncbi:MAG TPA: MFS transporter [Candidatus Limnocylindria bacterium]|nr:MFS transporter [Candidatus Limnocylindria bacterium]